MHSSNPFVAGLSLTTVGNLATPDIARDLMMEVEKHLRGGKPYLVKKVMLRLLVMIGGALAFFCSSLCCSVCYICPRELEWRGRRCVHFPVRYTLEWPVP